MFLLRFILIVNVRPLSVCFDLLFNFIYDSLVAISWERAIPLAFHLCWFLFWCYLNCRCPFPVWCLGQDVEFDCVGSWSLPFYLLFIILRSLFFSVVVTFHIVIVLVFPEIQINPSALSSWKESLGLNTTHWPDSTSPSNRPSLWGNISLLWFRRKLSTIISKFIMWRRSGFSSCTPNIHCIATVAANQKTWPYRNWDLNGLY